METGLAYVVAAKATETNGVVSYSNGMELAEAVSADININFETKKFYSNNRLRTTRRKFKDGSIKLGLDDLGQTQQKFVLGGDETDAGITGDTETKELSSGGDDTVPYLGIGFYANKVVGDTDKVRAIWLRYTKFEPSAESLKTQGESLEFANPTIVGAIYEAALADGGKVKYKDEVTVDTEAKAKEWLNKKAGITEDGE